MHFWDVISKYFVSHFNADILYLNAEAVTRVFEAQRQKYLDGLPERQEATAKKLKDKIVTSRRRRVCTIHHVYIYIYDICNNSIVLCFNLLALCAEA